MRVTYQFVEVKQTAARTYDEHGPALGGARG